MAFPNEIVTFPTMLDATTTDGPLIATYQNAVQAQDSATAATALAAIPGYNRKIITAALLNSITNTITDIETYFAARYSPAYIVSETQPVGQEATDFWFEVTS